MKIGTYGQKLKFTLVDEKGEPLPLEGGTITLYFKVGGVVKEFDCIIEDANEGVVSYVVKEGDLDKTGKASMEVEAAFSGQLFVTENKIQEVIKERVKE